MELLIIKCNDHYIRVVEDGYLDCEMEKASVFKLEELHTVKKHVKILEKKKYAQIRIHKLIILEELFEES